MFAAYHLSLETSFLVDEGATIPRMPLNPSVFSLEKAASDNQTLIPPTSSGQNIPEVVLDACSHKGGYTTDLELLDPRFASLASDAYDGDVGLTDFLDSKDSDFLHSLESQITPHPELVETMDQDGENEVSGVSGEYFSSTDANQSILVSFSSRCVLKRAVCERSRLLRIKFYGCFDKPLGRYLRDDLFDQASNFGFISLVDVA